MWKENPDGTETPNQLFFTKAEQKRRYAREKKERQTAEMIKRSDALYKVQEFLRSQGLSNEGKSLEQIKKEVFKDIRSKDPARITIDRCIREAKERKKAEKEKNTILTDNDILVHQDFIEIPEELNYQKPNYQIRLEKWKPTEPGKARKRNNKRLNESQKPKSSLEILQEEITNQEKLEKKAQKEQVEIEKIARRAERLKTREYRALKDEINKKVNAKMKDLFVGLYGYEPTKTQYWQFYRKADSIKRTRKKYLKELLKEYGLDQDLNHDLEQIDESKYTVDELWEIYNPPEINFYSKTSFTNNPDELRSYDLELEEINQNSLESQEITSKLRKARGRYRKHNIGDPVRMVTEKQPRLNFPEPYQGDRYNNDGLIVIDQSDPLLRKYNARESWKRRISRTLTDTTGTKRCRKRREVIKEKLGVQEHPQGYLLATEGRDS